MSLSDNALGRLTIALANNGVGAEVALALNNAITGVFTNLAVSGSATVTTNLLVSGSETITTNLTVTGSETISTNLAVTGTLSAGNSTVGTLTTGGNVTLADGNNIVINTATGTQVGTGATQKLGFWGATPVVLQAGGGQASVGATGSTQTTPYGYASSAQADGIVTLLNALRLALVNAGLIKGSA